MDLSFNKKFYPYLKFLIPVIFLGFILVCSGIPKLSEAYMTHCYPVMAGLLSFLSGWVSFSFLDLLIIAAIIILPVSILLMILKKVSFRKWIQIFVLSVLWLIIWFYMAWGIGYFRMDFNTRFGAEPPEEDKAYFEAFVGRYIDSLNHAYVSDPHLDIKEIDAAIEETYKEKYPQLKLPYPCGKRRTKYTLTENLMTRMGVAGFFGPFFNEVHVNNFLLPVSYPFTLAHEKAHQFGITGEAECNLYASVICCSSDHPLVRYSGYLQTVSYLLGNLRKMSPEEYPGIYKKIDPHIMDDYRKIREHWEKALNPVLSEIQDKVYDSYLKANQQQSGIRGYSEMVGLLLAWEKLNH